MARSNIRTPKVGQLRVRITDHERQLLDILARQRYDNNLSDVIREALSTMLDPNRRAITIGSESSRKLQRLAELLSRSPEAVLDECIAGIEEMVDAEGSDGPLIVKECKLRRDYAANKPAPAVSSKKR